MTSKRKPSRDQTTARKLPKHAPAAASSSKNLVPNSPIDDAQCVAEIATEIVHSSGVYDLDQFCHNSSGSPQKGFKRLSMSKIRQLLEHKFKIGPKKLGRLLSNVRESVGAKYLSNVTSLVEVDCEESADADESDEMGSSHVSCSDLSDGESDEGELVYTSKRSRRQLAFTDDEDSDCSNFASAPAAFVSANAIIGDHLVRRADVSIDRPDASPSAGMSVGSDKRSSSIPFSSSSSEALPASTAAASASLRCAEKVTNSHDAEVYDVGDDKVDAILVRSVDAVVAVVMDQYAIDGALLSDQQFLRQVPAAREGGARLELRRSGCARPEVL